MRDLPNDGQSPRIPADHRKLFNYFGVPFYVTPSIWQTLLLWPVVGIAIAFIFFSGSWAAHLFWGLIYGVLAGLSYVFGHLAGHIYSGRGVGAVMDRALLDGVRVVNVYENHDVRPEIHLARAGGGPLANFVLSMLAIVFWAFSGWHWLLFLGMFNLLLGLAALLPVTGADGEVIWRELRAIRGQNGR